MPQPIPCMQFVIMTASHEAMVRPAVAIRTNRDDVAIVQDAPACSLGVHQGHLKIIVDRDMRVTLTDFNAEGPPGCNPHTSRRTPLLHRPRVTWRRKAASGPYQPPVGPA